MSAHRLFRSFGHLGSSLRVGGLVAGLVGMLLAAGCDTPGHVDGPGAARESGQPIFNGTNLEGWRENGGGKWSVVDGAIVGETGDGRYGWLIYEKPVTDFVLEFEAKHDERGNSGIQFRSALINDEMCGFQADFDPEPEGGTGGIYDEGSGGAGWLYKPDAQTVTSTMKAMEWNRYRIRAQGDRIQTWINGHAIADIRSPLWRTGLLALQVHSGAEPPVRVRFRNLRLTDLGDCPEGGTACWTPLFNGADLTGWHTQGEPDPWKVVDGVIIGELVKPSPYAYLTTDKTYGDFELKLQMKFDTPTGNSGVFFRSIFPPHCTKCDTVARNLAEDVQDFKCPKCGHTETRPLRDRVHIHGAQAEFAPAAHKNSPTAAVYDARGHGWVNLDKITDRMRAMNRQGEWNELRLIAVGDHIRTYLNGMLVSDITDYDFPDRGNIALQLHETKEKIRVAFRDIVLREIQSP